MNSGYKNPCFFRGLFLGLFGGEARPVPWNWGPETKCLSMRVLPVFHSKVGYKRPTA